MEDLLKKIINTSLGAAILAKDKIKEFIDELVNKGKLTEEEGKRFMDDLRKETNKSGKNIEEEVRRIMERMLDRMDIATKKDLKVLQKKIDELENEILKH